jgi:hypothetical protein
MSRALAMLVLVLAALFILVGPAGAYVGDRCRAARDCLGAGPQFCLADSVHSDTGRCVAGRVLP